MDTKKIFLTLFFVTFFVGNAFAKVGVKKYDDEMRIRMGDRILGVKDEALKTILSIGEANEKHEKGKEEAGSGKTPGSALDLANLGGEGNSVYKEGLRQINLILPRVRKIATQNGRDFENYFGKPDNFKNFLRREIKQRKNPGLSIIRLHLISNQLYENVLEVREKIIFNGLNGIDEQIKNIMALFGAVSGRDEDAPLTVNGLRDEYKSQTVNPLSLKPRPSEDDLERYINN